MKEEVPVPTELSQLKPENLFEALNAKDNIDILCIKAKNAYSTYDINKAYEISIK